MSLVNQMLRDLETRREREEAAPPPRAEVRAVRIVRGNGHWPLLAGGVAILAAGAIYATVTIGGDLGRPTATAATTPVQTAPIARAKTPATAEGRDGQRSVTVAARASDPPQRASSAHDSTQPHPSAAGRATQTDSPAEHDVSQQAAAPAESAAAAVTRTTVASAPTHPAERHSTSSPVASHKSRATTAKHRDAAPQMTKTPHPVTAAQRAAAAYAAGVSAAQAGDIAGAESEFHAALTADPGAYGAREALAALLNQQGRMKQAMQLFVTGMQVDPAHRERFARAYARLLVAHNQIAQAVTILKETLPPATQAPEHYAFLAALQERQGKHQAAVANYAKALAVQPTEGRWWAGLAVAYDQLREPDKALAAYQRARDAGGLGVTLATYVNRRISALQP